ncbi:hypothetical protein [Winogradskyella sp.]|uniref:hypothetical protein n=1 Tax=Winogradskyella sp. TaxID=1883156 RepID=UPI003BA8442D
MKRFLQIINGVYNITIPLGVNASANETLKTYINPKTNIELIAETSPMRFCFQGLFKKGHDNLH